MSELLVATLAPDLWGAKCPVCDHLMRYHLDEGGAFAICEDIGGPYGGRQCKCDYTTAVESQLGQRWCSVIGEGVEGCDDPAHCVGTDQWWQTVLLGSAPSFKPCRSKQEIEDDALLEAVAPTRRLPYREATATEIAARLKTEQLAALYGASGKTISRHATTS